MENIDKIYPKEVIAILAESKEQQVFVHTLTSDDEHAVIYRTELNKWLGSGLALGIIDDDKINRLRGPDSDQRLQTIQELMAAYYFNDILGFPLTPNPSGHGQRVGEFEVTLPGLKQPVFCEVKTPIRERPLEGRWNGNDANAIRSVLKTAYEQIPKDKRPSIAILTGKLRAPISSQFSGVIEAIYGQPVFIGKFDTTKGSSNGFKASHIRNGFFQPKFHRHLSAVITLEDWLGSPRLDSMMMADTKDEVDWSLPMNEFKYVLKMYHNPYALKKIPFNVFSSYKQYSFDFNSRKILNFENAK